MQNGPLPKAPFIMQRRDSHPLSIYDYAKQENSALVEYIDRNLDFYTSAGTTKENFMFDKANNEVVLKVTPSNLALKKFNTNIGSLHGGYETLLADSTAGALVMCLLGKEYLPVTKKTEANFILPLVSSVEFKVVSKFIQIGERKNEYIIRTEIFQKYNGVDSLKFESDSVISILQSDLAKKLIEISEKRSKK